MGQRSQIYIRYNFEKEGYGKGLIARYFQWNYGTRMISRAASIIEFLQKYSFIERGWPFTDKSYMTKLIRACDINFDMRDIVLSSDIIQECIDENSIEWLFKQDNNDGHLLVDMKKDSIKYAFTNGDDYKPMTPTQYMNWNEKDWEKTLDEEEYLYTMKNIRFIKNEAVRMTRKEVESFYKANYDYLLNVKKDLLS